MSNSTDNWYGTMSNSTDNCYGSISISSDSCYWTISNSVDNGYGTISHCTDNCCCVISNSNKNCNCSNLTDNCYSLISNSNVNCNYSNLTDKCYCSISSSTDNCNCILYGRPLKLFVSAMTSLYLQCKPWVVTYHNKGDEKSSWTVLGVILIDWLWYVKNVEGKLLLFCVDVLYYSPKNPYLTSCKVV